MKGTNIINWINEYKMPDTMGRDRRYAERRKLAEQGIMAGEVSDQLAFQTDFVIAIRAKLVLDFLNQLTDEEFAEAENYHKS